MTNKKIGLQSAVSSILTTFVILLPVSCGTVYYGLLMKGSILEASGSEVYLDAGSKHEASVGQELAVYEVPETKPETLHFTRVLIGRVRITEIIDEYFAKATVISGKAEKGDIVELTRRK